MDRIRILTFFGRIGAGLGFSVGLDRSRIVISRNWQLKYAVFMFEPEVCRSRSTRVDSGRSHRFSTGFGAGL